jgi:hypothetical protein
MKSFAKRKWAYRPRVEALEAREQPGSLLWGMGSLLADLSLPPAQGIGGDEPLSISRRFHLNDSQPGGHVAQAAAGVAVTAPDAGRLVQTQAPTQVKVAADNNANLNALQQALGVASSHAGASSAAGTAHGSTISVGGTGTQSNAKAAAAAVTRVATPVAAQAEHTAHVASVNPMPPLKQLSASDFVQLPTGNGGGISNDTVTASMTSFAGAAGDDRLTAVKILGDGTIVATGYGTLANGDQAVIFLHVDPTQSGGAALLANRAIDIGQGNNAIKAVGNDITADANGDVYVIGQDNSSGFNNIDYFGFADPNFHNLLWEFNIPDHGNDAGNGLKLDAAGNLDLTGSIDDSGNGNLPANLYLGQLASPNTSSPTVNFSGFVAITDSNGIPRPTVGNKIATDSNSQIDVAMTLTSGNGNPGPAFTAFDVHGNLLFGRYFSGGGLSQKEGFNSVDTDASNNMYFAGTVTNTIWSPHLSMMISKFDQNGNSLYRGDGILHDAVDQDGNFVNWYGNSNRAIDGDGSQAIASTLGEASTGGGFTCVYRVSPDGESGDASFQQVGGGSNDDESLGMDVGAPDSSGNFNYAQVGYTSSPDFNVTPSAFQPTYGGGPYDGWVSVYQVM